MLRAVRTLYKLIPPVEIYEHLIISASYKFYGIKLLSTPKLILHKKFVLQIQPR